MKYTSVTYFIFLMVITVMASQLVSAAASCDLQIQSSGNLTCGTPNKYVLNISGVANGLYYFIGSGNATKILVNQTPLMISASWTNTSINGTLYSVSFAKVCSSYATISACPPPPATPPVTPPATNSTPLTCQDRIGSAYEPNETSCDNIDNDCDGQVDEGCYVSNILSFDGRFYACNLNYTYGNIVNPVVPGFIWTSLGMKFEFMYPQSGLQASPNDISNEMGQCTNKGSWYCDSFAPIPLWRNSFIYNDSRPVDSSKYVSASWPDSYYNTTLYPIQPSVATQTLCCPSSYCSDGNICIDSGTYLNDPKKAPIYMAYGQSGYRCTGTGNWEVQSLKPDFYHDDTGYCGPSSCYAQNHCYQSGEWNVFAGTDRMCASGSWTTRAKYIALALVNYTEQNNIPDYTIYCDTFENVVGESLDTINYDVAPNRNFLGYFGIGSQPTYQCDKGTDGRCVNAACILSFDNHVIFAISLNKELNETTYPVQQAFGFLDSDKTSASFTTGDEVLKLYASDKSGKLSYSRSKQVIFYTADNTLSVPDFTQNLVISIISVIIHPISSLIDFFKTATTQGPQFGNALDNVEDFDRLYLAHVSDISGPKSISGFIERKYNDQLNQLQTVMAINYTGFNSVDICAAVNGRINDVRSCSNVSDSAYVFYAINNATLLDSIWPDLTAKTRIQ